MLKAKVIKKKNGATSKLLKSLQSLHNSSVEVGHFKSSGLHGDSDLTYPELLKIWSLGAAKGNEGVVRNPLLSFSFSEIQSHKIHRHPDIKAAYRRWSKNVLNSSSTASLLDDIGIVLRRDYASVFGRIGPYMPPTKNTNTPMFDSGELAANAAYRTSKGNTVKELSK